MHVRVCAGGAVEALVCVKVCAHVSRVRATCTPVTHTRQTHTRMSDTHTHAHVYTHAHVHTRVQALQTGLVPATCHLEVCPYHGCTPHLARRDTRPPRTRAHRGIHRCTHIYTCTGRGRVRAGPGPSQRRAQVRMGMYVCMCVYVLDYSEARTGACVCA